MGLGGNSEIQTDKVNHRLDYLEDPISSLHPDVKALSSEIYSALRSGASTHLAFDDAFYQRFRRPLAALEAQGDIKGGHTIGKRYAVGLSITSSRHILYMAALFESDRAMAKLVQAVDTCKPNTRLDGNVVAAGLGLPVPVVRAVLELYRDKGYGLLSNEVGSNVYVAKV